MSRSKFAFLIFISSVILSACNGQKPLKTMGYCAADYEINYELNAPDTVLWLDKTLNEISGLTYSRHLDQLLTINDEKGIMYKLDKHNGQILQKWDIGKKGDYEGIASDGSIVYITRSNGKVTIYDLTSEHVKDIEGNKFNEKNDIEGLTYHQGALLIAPKENGLKGAVKNKNYIYKIDLSIEMDPSVFTVFDVIEDRKQLRGYNMEDYPYPYIMDNKLSSIYPSGIVMHNEHHLYMVSGKNSNFAVIDVSGNKLIGIYSLSEAIHPQAEGITMDDKGTLYISNEAAGGTARINVFYPKHH